MTAMRLLCFLWNAAGLDLTKLTSSLPANEGRYARDPKISGDGRFVVFESDSDFYATGLSRFGSGAAHVWMRPVGMSNCSHSLDALAFSSGF